MNEVPCAPESAVAGSCPGLSMSLKCRRSARWTNESCRPAFRYALSDATLIRHADNAAD